MKIKSVRLMSRWTSVWVAESFRIATPGRLLIARRPGRLIHRIGLGLDRQLEVRPTRIQSFERAFAFARAR